VQKARFGDATYSAALIHLMHSAEKIYMGNLAQTCNVLACMIKTDGAKFLTTPLYHVFELYGPHRGGTVVHVDLGSNPILELPNEQTYPTLSVSATLDRDKGRLLISVVNLNLTEPQKAKVTFASKDRWVVRQVRRLDADSPDTANTFDAPNRVTPRTLRSDDFGSGRTTSYPPGSITTISLQLKGAGRP